MTADIKRSEAALMEGYLAEKMKTFQRTRCSLWSHSSYGWSTVSGHEFRILTHEAFQPLVEEKGVIYKKLDTDADHVMQYLVTDYKTSMDFMKGMSRLKKENPAFMEQTLDAVAGSDLVMYSTCSAFAYHAAAEGYTESEDLAEFLAAGEKIKKENGVEIAANAIEKYIFQAKTIHGSKPDS